MTTATGREDNWKLIRRKNQGSPEEDIGKGEPEKRSSQGKLKMGKCVDDISYIGTKLGKCDISDEQERRQYLYYGKVSTENDF